MATKQVKVLYFEDWSPTILVDGRDPWAETSDGFGLSCRIYRTEAGLEGSPSLAQPAAALGA
jgi:hypothetical protein